MKLIQPSRRGFLTGLIGLIAVPAIVKVTNLMPISVVRNPLILPYKGTSGFDAGIFYCPYVPLQYAKPTKGFTFKTTNLLPKLIKPQYEFIDVINYELKETLR